MSAELQNQIDELKQRISQFETEHAEHRQSHNSRRGVQGIAGPKGDTGSVGPSANPREVAELAANIVQKIYRYDAQNAKFDAFMDELEGEIARVKANLRFAIIEELKLSGVLDEKGNAHPSLRGEHGADSTVAGPTGSVGAKGNSGVDGKSVSKEEVAQLIRQILDEKPEKFRGLTGRDGVGKQGSTGADGKDGMTEEDVLNLVVKAIADPSLLDR